MYKNHLYLVNGEGNDRETALHGTLVYIGTIYDVITKTSRVLCWTYSCPYCIVYICGEWVIYAEPVTYWICNAYVEYVTNICYVPTPDFLYVNLLDLYIYQTCISTQVGMLATYRIAGNFRGSKFL